ncbi:hypothetical protein BRAO375_4730001 [Bradyrhizobium sp. ORS 375]|nr:hypothetical protein BRAO375_4730001 [Bradyrhizobium sp. ORS 375]
MQMTRLWVFCITLFGDQKDAAMGAQKN